MSTRRKVGLAAVLAAALALTAIAPHQAQATGPYYRETYPSKIFSKLWGGVSNVLFCWCEIPLEIRREIDNTDPFTGVVVGLGRGAWYTGRRAVLGVVDVVTFPVDIHDNNYQSVQRTEFPFIDEVE